MAELKEKYCPLGKTFASLTKLYIGAISEQLKQLDIERYYYVLLVISENNELTQKQLGEAIGHDKATMVRIVDYLQKKKYVKRKQNAADRRAHFITLTDKAETIIPDIRNAFEYVDTIALQSLKPDQIKILKQFFAAIESNLISMPATEVKLNFKRTKK